MTKRLTTIQIDAIRRDASGYLNGGCKGVYHAHVSDLACHVLALLEDREHMKAKGINFAALKMIADSDDLPPHGWCCDVANAAIDEDEDALQLLADEMGGVPLDRSQGDY